MPAPANRRSEVDVTRSFVALPCPDQLRDAIAAAHRKWVRLDADVRWVAPQGVHVTLRFLGNATGDQLHDLDPMLRETGRRRPPITLTSSQTGAFPGWRRPRILWLGLDDGGASRSLAADVETHARAVGFVPETRRFRPHITVARVKGNRGLKQVVDAVQFWRPQVPPEIVDEMILYASETTPTGPLYTVTARYPLEGAMTA